MEMLVLLMEIFAYSTNAVKKGTRERFSRFAKNLLLGDDGVIAGYVAKLDKLTKSEDLLQGALTLANTQKIIDGQDRMDQHMEKLFALSTPAQIQFRAEKRLEQAKSILRPSVSPLDLFDKIAKQRVAGTGSWVRNQQVFQDWITRKDAMLCLAGSPGFGKSFIAASMVSYLEDLVSHDGEGSHGSVAYFFFRDINPQTRKVDQCLRDLAYQIYQNDARFQAYFDSRFSSSTEVESPESIWREVFQNYFLRQNDAKGVFLVIDGVDEAFEEDREILYSLLAPDERFGKYQSSCKISLLVSGENRLIDCTDDMPSRIQILLTGRQHVLSELAMATNEDFPIIHVDRFKNKQDILKYIDRSMSETKSLKSFSPKLKKEVAETLALKSQGMFLWVDLMIRELRNKHRPGHIRDALQRAPRGLHEKVRNVLENYSLMFEDDEEAGDFNLILSWITCAAEPLPLAVIDESLKLRVGDEEGIPRLEEKLRHEWGVLLDLNRSDGLTTDDLESDSVKVYKDMDFLHIDERGTEVTEEEVGFEFASNPKLTKVVFCHASINEIFRSGLQEKVSSGDNPAIGVDIAEAATQTLHQCLEMICRTPQNSRETPIRDYAVRRWLDHVDLVCKHISNAKKESIEALGAFLVEMFQDEEVMKVWLSEASPDSFNKDNLETLLKIITNCGMADAFSSDIRQWIEEIVKRPVELFLPMTRFLTREWLQGGTWDTEFCTRIIYRVSCLESGQVADEAAHDLSANAVLEIAERAGLEQNSDWHRRIAMALRDMGHLEDAEEHFHAAMDLDERNWLAPAGLAKTQRLRGLHQECLALFKQSSEILESVVGDEVPNETQRGDLAGSYEDIAESALAVGDQGMALMFFKKCIGLSNGSDDAIVQYLQLLPWSDTDEIIRVIKSLDFQLELDPPVSHTRLTVLISSTGGFLTGLDEFWKVAAAFKTKGEIEWLQNAYRNAIVAAHTNQLDLQDSALTLVLADLFDVYDDKPEKAAHIWKCCLQLPETFFSSPPELKYHHSLAGRKYGMHLLCRAFDSKVGTPESNQFIKRLEEICVSNSILNDPSCDYSRLPLQNLILGIWNKTVGNHEEADAVLRPFMQTATSGIDEESAFGVSIFQIAVAKTLMATGDEARGIALLQAYCTPGTKAAVCYCRCGLFPESWPGGYCCKICLTDLCCDCTEILKQGNRLPVNVCSPEHSWVYVPKREDIPQKKVYFNDELIPITQLYKDIRKEWQF